MPCLLRNFGFSVPSSNTLHSSWHICPLFMPNGLMAMRHRESAHGASKADPQPQPHQEPAQQTRESSRMSDHKEATRGGQGRRTKPASTADEAAEAPDEDRVHEREKRRRRFQCGSRGMCIGALVCLVIVIETAAAAAKPRDVAHGARTLTHAHLHAAVTCPDSASDCLVCAGLYPDNLCPHHSSTAVVTSSCPVGGNGSLQVRAAKRTVAHCLLL